MVYPRQPMINEDQLVDCGLFSSSGVFKYACQYVVFRGGVHT